MAPLGMCLLTLSILFLSTATSIVNLTQTSPKIILSNSRLHTEWKISNGIINVLTLDGQDLLGPNSGSIGQGPYADCSCVPAGSWTPGSINARFKIFQGVDSTNTAYGGVVMGEVYPGTGQLFEQYFFLREGETGLHTFLHMAYHNTTTPFLRNLQELRFLFRPNTPLWTHLTTNADFYAPLPVPDPASGATGIATIVQDTTWDISNRTGDPYVEQMSDYFTKYTFQDTNRDHDVHGLFADGSTSSSNFTYGAWMVMNTKDTYFGGPLSSDLTVDGIVYNYIVSNHHGDGTPNITDGFDRTFGPQFYYFNKGAASTSLATLRNDALKYYSPSFAADFYDSIAEYVPNYVPTSGRGSWSAKIHLPDGATNPIAVLAASGVDFQDNTFNTTAYQYWATIGSSGRVEIDRIKAGTYRLTVYADGIFGQYTKDGIIIKPKKPTDSSTLHWEAESAGIELWRVGSPDKSSGEFRHGYERDAVHPLHPPEHRVYWGAYDFPSDFPNGVNFTVGKSDVAKDFNYVHWSVFGGFSDSRRPMPYYGDGNVNNWTVLFDATSKQLKKKTQATFTIQLAGAKTAAGNTDVFNSTQLWNNLPLTVVVNGHQLESWVIPYYQSSSCAVRSAVSCYNLAHKFVSPTSHLVADAENEIILSLPFNATDYESAVLPASVYIQYDALRLEVD